MSSDSIFILSILAACILFAGDPDISDGITARLMATSDCQKAEQANDH